jgi:hypothetical protein
VNFQDWYDFPLINRENDIEFYQVRHQYLLIYCEKALKTDSVVLLCQLANDSSCIPTPSPQGGGYLFHIAVRVDYEKPLT